MIDVTICYIYNASEAIKYFVEYNATSVIQSENRLVRQFENEISPENIQFHQKSQDAAFICYLEGKAPIR